MMKIIRMSSLIFILCLLFTSASFAESIPHITEKNAVTVYLGEVQNRPSEEALRAPYRVTYQKVIYTEMSVVNKEIEDVTYLDFSNSVYYTEPAPDGSNQLAVGTLNRLERAPIFNYGNDIQSFWFVFYGGEMSYYIY